MSDFIDPNPDCLNCSYLLGRKYKLCDECFAVVMKEAAIDWSGPVGLAVTIAADDFDGGRDIVELAPHERRNR